jgi:hypothetical protein
VGLGNRTHFQQKTKFYERKVMQSGELVFVPVSFGYHKEKKTSRKTTGHAAVIFMGYHDMQQQLARVEYMGEMFVVHISQIITQQ